jgi:hypothetical protein
MTVFALTVGAQRRITPVTNPDKKVATDTVDSKANLKEMMDASGHIVLVDTVLGKEYHDTLLMTAPKLVYPRYQAVSIGVNLADPLMRCLGQSYGLIGFWGELSIHNWIKPVVEFGFGEANYTPDDEDYTYKSSIAPYFKLGLNYNFLYNSNPDYSAYVGLRYGLSNFSYEVNDVKYDQGYWGETGTIGIPSQRVTVGYFEFIFGIRVRIINNFNLGWEVKAHALANQGNPTYGRPWYVPGYGTRGSLFTATFSLSYTLPLSPKPVIQDKDNKKK